MDLFITVLVKLLPLYFYTVMGFVLGKWRRISTKTLVDLLLYFIIPIVVFYAGFSVQLNISSMLLPVTIYLLSALVMVLGFILSSLFWRDTHRHITAANISLGNFGYLGLSVALVLFDKPTAAVYALLVPAAALFQFTAVLFIIARGKRSFGQSIKEVFKLPMNYAFVAGLLLNALYIKLPVVITNMAQDINSAFAIIGMMLIGTTLADVKKFVVDWRFTAINMIGKCILWPAVAYVFIWLDQSLLQLFNTAAYQSILLFSLLPFAANTAALAQEYDMHTDKASFTIFFGTVCAIILVPFMAALFGLVHP